MTTFALILTTLLAIAAVANLWYAYKSDLQMLQQNSYRNDRYFRWWKASNNYYSVNRIIDLIVLLLMLSQFSKLYVVIPIAIIALATKVILAAKKKYKKPLVCTRRVWRLLTTMLVLSAIVMATACVPNAEDLSTAIYAVAIAATTLSVLSWGILAICNKAMMPVESAINKMYCDDARRILSEMQGLKIIGITGSYGKTSTKHYLYRILSERYNVLMTPGSFNTPMGVVRTVREQMKPYHEVFIVEMGAKQIGDIKEICDLVHPEIGIITAVGEQHLESFKSIENVQRTKFELADALPADGFVVLNDDFEYIANRPVENTAAYRYAIKEVGNANFTARDIEYSETGTHFTIEGEGKTLQMETRLVGECNISNLMAAIITAIKLGISEEHIKYAVGKIEQVEHRLSIRKTPAGITVIDDAFNSNPDGSRMALDVLSRMKKGKRIVVTPGMIELGEKQEMLNKQFGERIASSCDIAIIVGQYNRDAILEGIRENGQFDENKLIVVDTFAEAQSRLATLLQSGDIVLYENDLPDTFK